MKILNYKTLIIYNREQNKELYLFNQETYQIISLNSHTTNAVLIVTAINKIVKISLFKVMISINGAFA